MALHHPAVQRAHPPQHPGHARESVAAVVAFFKKTEKKKFLKLFKSVTFLFEPLTRASALGTRHIFFFLKKECIHKHLNFKRQQSSLEGFFFFFSFFSEPIYLQTSKATEDKKKGPLSSKKKKKKTLRARGKRNKVK